MKYEMYDVAKRVLRERVRANIHLIPPIMLAAVEMNAETSQNADAHLGAVAMLLFPEELEDIVDLELIKTTQANSLVVYRKECVAAAVEVAMPAHNHYRWMSDHWTTVNWFKDSKGQHGRGNCNEGGNCFIGQTSGKIMMRFWWREYIYAAKAELEKWPCGSSVQRGEIFDKAIKDGSQCVKCAPGLEGQLRKFAALFASEVDKAVSSVQLVL
ncbi:hypothetical protein GALMADRAFT_1311552 [Galerina marginata CBS 339.88]|uniref:Uncharacterized protein n=1 Tax=Galerina marginata (strain CBS 339.88) TaxID=685588 RepID=A0A067T520_GALM3|nr:hypothetical protein GALMADRAFT_1311552 [Galerina marginata CBS 339.88]